METPLDRVLVIQAARFGDLLQSKRLILTLKKRCETHLAIDRSLLPLAKIIYPDITVYGLSLHGCTEMPELEKDREIFGAWQDLNFRHIYTCNFSSLATSLCRLFDQEKIIGYRPDLHSTGGIYKSPWCRLVFRISRDRALASLNLADFWGWFDHAPIPGVEVNPRARGGGKGLGIALAGRNARRSLPPEILAKIVDTLFAIGGYRKIKLFGTSQERRIAKKMLRLLSRKTVSSCVDLCGQTDWLQLCDEMRGLDLLITPDTGIMHLAAHFGVPVMAFFLSSAWCHETGPYGSGHMIWQATPSCAPCLESAPCSNNLLCLDSFTGNDFLRNLVFWANGQKNKLSPGDGLQLWQTDFDCLGQKLDLVAGKDLAAIPRQTRRLLIARFLGLECGQDIFGMPMSDVKKLAAEYCPPDEWMLPPWRYD